MIGWLQFVCEAEMIESRWNHSICNNCWKWTHPNRTPVRLKVPNKEKCCFCGAEHSSGIYVRGNPEAVPCEGKHQ
jgi:hypothetical protein